MIKNIFIILSIVTAPHLMAMEEPLPCCYFKEFPIDTLNSIAQFLTFDDVESEQEFIERTTLIEKKDLPQSCCKHLPDRELGMGCITGYSPDNRKVTVLQSEVWPQFGCSKNTLVIIDIQKNRLVYQKSADKQAYNNIALSRNAQRFATTHLEIDTAGDLCTDVMRYKTVLTVNSIKTQKKAIFDLFNHKPFKYTNHYIAFNKQGTHIIAHYTNCTNYHQQPTTSTKKYIIIQLNRKTLDKKRITKTLDRYFAQRGVCKNLSKQLLTST